MNSGQFDQDLYTEYDVKRGLRDSNGKGILTGLTEISDVVAFESVHGRKMPIDGQLYYQGYNIINLIEGHGDDRFGFEEITYLLLFGELPNKAQLDEFLEILGNYRELPDNFVRDIIMNSPNANMMNVLQKSVLTLYSYDPAPEDVSINNVLRQSLQLIARFPLISVYGYHSYRHYILDKSLVIRRPKPELSTAENILRLLRPDGQYTELEAKVLDVALIIHAEHGGGNNSTFTTHVVTSTGTDTYSAIAASLGSLKGPKHGGANLKVQQMFDDIKAHINNWEDEDELSAYLLKILRKEAFDNKGLIYGIGHAVYTESDPRCIILKKYAKALSDEKGLTKEFELYNRIERLAIQLTQQERRLFKPICANVDFYSGFVYTMLGLPTELFTPMFAISRISGWCAHRIEELVNEGKIIRPAYRYVGHHKDYVDIDNRWW
jgi:citrate synthase